MNNLAGTYIVNVDKEGKTTVVDTSGQPVPALVGFQAFRVIQTLQANPGVIEQILIEKFGVQEIKEVPAGMTAPLFSHNAEKAKRMNLAVLIRRCAFTELQHIASEGYDETPDLKGRNLSDIRHDFDFQMDTMIGEGLISETERNYALRYFARKIDPVQPFSMGIIKIDPTTEAYESMVDDILSWYNTKYLVNGYVLKELDTNEVEEVMTMRQYVLLCQTGLQQKGVDMKISEGKLTEIFAAICHMLKPDRTTKSST